MIDHEAVTQEAHDALIAMLANPARHQDLVFALNLADELAPSPVSAHTALLVLRATLADVAGVPIDQLMAMFSPTAQTRHQ